jgi:uncharacterized membrane protein YcaP (DUF421 family)
MDLSAPWWVYALRGMGVYLGLLILLRMLGKRSFGEMTTFDIVVLMLVGGTLRTAIIGDDKAPLAPVIGVLAIFLLDKALAWVAARWPAFDRLVEGKDSLLAREGRLIEGALRRHDVSEAAFGGIRMTCVTRARLSGLFRSAFRKPGRAAPLRARCAGAARPATGPGCV